MRVDITKNGQQWKSIAGKALISFMTPSDSVQLIDQFLVSLNVTSRPENVVAVNKLFITQQPQEHPDLLKFLVMSDVSSNCCSLFLWHYDKCFFAILEPEKPKQSQIQH